MGIDVGKLWYGERLDNRGKCNFIVFEGDLSNGVVLEKDERPIIISGNKIYYKKKERTYQNGHPSSSLWSVPFSPTLVHPI